MDAIQKIKNLNTLAEVLRCTLESVNDLCDKDPDVSHYVYQINKKIMQLHAAIAKHLDKQITDDEFNRIIKNLEKNIGEE
jgi:hypothetical protein